MLEPARPIPSRVIEEVCIYIKSVIPTYQRKKKRTSKIQSKVVKYPYFYLVKFGLELSSDSPPPPLPLTSAPPPPSLVKVQLPDVGVNVPPSADWKSPKSPKLSEEESSSEKEELNMNESPTVPGPPLGSEKGPKPSCREKS